jgi:hypothetical protein
VTKGITIVYWNTPVRVLRRNVGPIAHGLKQQNGARWFSWGSPLISRATHIAPFAPSPEENCILFVMRQRTSGGGKGAVNFHVAAYLDLVHSMLNMPTSVEQMKTKQKIHMMILELLVQAKTLPIVCLVTQNRIDETKMILCCDINYITPRNQETKRNSSHQVLLRLHI